MNPLLNRVVRGYLAHSPFTEGKKSLLRLTRAAIRPASSQQSVRTRHGFRLLLNLDNPEQERIYFYGEHDERYETALLKALIDPGTRCWDIGANIGYYTCLLAVASGPSGQVIAFEPASQTRSRLLHNVALNGLANVQVMPCALGAGESVARIHYREAGRFEGTASLLPGEEGGQSEEVAVSSIDHLAAQLGAPEFLKIDVEGAQLDVWRGGREFFANREPLVMAELRDSDDPAVLESIEAAVRGYGYAIFSIHKHARVREVARLHVGGPRNYMLAKPGSGYGRRLRSRAG